MAETRFDGVRVRYDSTKSYEELVAALLDDTAEQPDAKLAALAEKVSRGS